MATTHPWLVSSSSEPSSTSGLPISPRSTGASDPLQPVQAADRWPPNGEPAGSEPTAGRPPDSKPDGSQRGKGQAAAGRPAESQPPDSEPAGSQPATGQPAESEPATGPRPDGEPAGSQRLRLLVAYLGAPFHGFALQDGVPTVAGALGAALEKVLRHSVELTCAGRTDAGVHAWGQVVSLDVRAGADLCRLQRSLNKMLGPTVVIREAAWAPDSFDARRSAVSRRYRYHMLCSEWADPLDAATTWHVGRPLDLRRMEAAGDVLLGEHDFTSFCHAIRHRPGPLVRRVLRAEWLDLGASRVCFEIEATSFCQQMVRSIVGTLVEVGSGRRTAGELMSILSARDRSAAGQIAPPHGLCLWEVRYPPGALGRSP
jgi:tRNA pseudouridine38-40 synthase